MDDKKNIKKINLISAVLIGAIILIIIILVFLYMRAKAENKLSSTKENNQTSEILNKNDNSDNLEAAKKQAIEEAASASSRPVRQIDDSDHILGNISAPVQLIIYDDFECPFCADFYDTVKQIKEYFGKQVVIAFRHYPLSFHSLAMPAALASECASEQGKFWEMYDLLFTANKENNLSAAYFKEAADDLGLDLVQFNQCFDTEKYKDKIQAQFIEGKNFGVSGTPGNFINGEPAPGAVPFEDFTDSQGRQREGMKSIIERHLEKL